jgi:hypothetical protein
MAIWNFSDAPSTTCCETRFGLSLREAVWRFLPESTEAAQRSRFGTTDAGFQSLTLSVFLRHSIG